MPGLFLRLCWAAMALACIGSPAISQPRPLAVDDIVRLEAFGRAALSPDGHWLVYEKRGAYDAAPRFDYGPRSTWAIMDLWLVDLRQSGPPQRLLPDEPPGLLRGSWSPSGDRLLVYRFRDDRLEVGVVTMADRSVRWTALTPEMPLMGAAFEWVSDDHVALVVRPDHSLPWLLGYYGESQRRTAAAWSRTAAGDAAARTVIDARGGIATAEAASADKALVLLDVGSGQAQVLRRGGVVDFAVSPDGTRIAVMEEGEPIAVGDAALRQGEPPMRQRLVLIETSSGATRPIGAGLDVAPHLLRWSSDSADLLVWARSGDKPWTEGELIRAGRDGQVSTLDLGGLRPVLRDDDISVLQGVRAEWMGDIPVLFGRPPNSDRDDWYALWTDRSPRAVSAGMPRPPGRLSAVSEAGLYAFDAGALWSIGAEGARALTPADLKLEPVYVSDPEKPFRLTSNDAPRRDWALGRSPDGEVLSISSLGAVRPLGVRRFGPEARVLAADDRTVLVLERDGLVETLRRGTVDSLPVDAVNAGFAAVALPMAAPLDHEDLGGRPARSWLFLPPGVASAADVKGLIVQVYPGAIDTGAWSGPMTLTYGVRATVLAGSGYAVLSAFVPTEAGSTAEALERSVDLAVEAAFAAQPDLPRDRIVVFGHSFGGNAALWIATRSRKYRAYISWAGASDLFTQWGEFAPVSRITPGRGFMLRNQQGWAETGQAGLGGTPWSEANRYRDASPYLAADQITAPVLLIGGDRDFVTISQSERMFSALYRLGRRARLVTYWGEEHLFWSPANIRDLYRQIFDWLDEILADPQPTDGAPGDGPRHEANLRTQPPA